MSNIYLDYAAATPISPEVLEAMAPFFTDRFYNPSALYLRAQSVNKELAEARASVASQLGCKPSEVIFLAGGTESDNLAVNGVMQSFKGKNIVISAIEHEAVIAPASNYDVRVASVNEFGVVDVEDLTRKIDDNTVMVSVMYANNEVGSIQPIREISKLLSKIKESRQTDDSEGLPLYFHTDACQATNYLPTLVNSLGVDMMTLNGGKIYGPKQSGVLYVKTGTKLNPQILGGGQERGLRSGTENIAGVIGFAKALEEAYSIRDQEVARLEILRDELISELKQISDRVIINGAKNRLANNIHFTLTGYDNERLMMELDERGIMVATGSACSASSEEPSHVLKAMGISDEDSRSSIRLTLGRQSSKEHVSEFINSIKELV